MSERISRTSECHACQKNMRNCEIVTSINPLRLSPFYGFGGKSVITARLKTKSREYEKVKRKAMMMMMMAEKQLNDKSLEFRSISLTRSFGIQGVLNLCLYGSFIHAFKKLKYCLGNYSVEVLNMKGPEKACAYCLGMMRANVNGETSIES